MADAWDPQMVDLAVQIVPIVASALPSASSKKIKATTTSLLSSHVPMQSRSEDLAAIILAAAGKR